MAKAAQVRRDKTQLPAWATPVLTLGLYGLPRLRPYWLYTTVALLILLAWLAVGVGFALANPGSEPLVAPLLFVVAIITFLRLARPQAAAAVAHRRA